MQAAARAIRSFQRDPFFGNRGRSVEGIPRSPASNDFDNQKISLPQTFAYDEYGYPLKDFSISDSSGEESTDDEESFCEYYRWITIGMICKLLCGACCLSLVVALILAYVLPGGKPAYNETFFNKLVEMKDVGATFPMACKFKQYNFYRSSGIPGPDGPSDDGKWNNAPNIFDINHHMGLILWTEYPNSTRTEYIRLDFGYYGLRYNLIGSPLVADVLPWSSECYYWCGHMSPEKGDPIMLLNEFRSYLETWKYNIFRLNCNEFATYLYAYFKPTNEGCQPFKVID
eukprot:TRINITY_DN6766_c0_g1_i1.p1 TRINITY_DN6766_c0_g1~~TRINITY_DN6766_c0_g1_i1.p1  ORF type:complete len:286 (+),score=20.79 TRINITY_DN6766_c0_g1_i1:62-919(+)